MKYSLVISAIAGLAAAGSAPESSRAAAVHAASPCESVREDCIQASLSEGNSPNFAECAASSASCLQSAAPTATEEAAVWTTTVVTAYTTYCPSATSVVQGNKTYTATASETLTITDCPCTISTPVAAAPMWAPAPSVQPMPASNGTQGPFVPVGTASAPGAPRGSGAPVVPGAPGTTVPYTGAAGYLAPSVGIVALIFGAAMLF